METRAETHRRRHDLSQPGMRPYSAHFTHGAGAAGNIYRSRVAGVISKIFLRSRNQSRPNFSGSASLEPTYQERRPRPSHGGLFRSRFLTDECLRDEHSGTAAEGREGGPRTAGEAVGNNRRRVREERGGEGGERERKE